MVSRLELAAMILAGIAANPTEAHVRVEIAVKKALDITDELIRQEGAPREEDEKDYCGSDDYEGD